MTIMLAKPGARSSELMKQVMARARSCGLSEKSINRIYLEAEGFGADYAYERYPLWNGHLTGSDDGKVVFMLEMLSHKYNDCKEDYDSSDS